MDRVRARPGITLKLATSLDGRIATASGESKWITGEAARRVVQMLRLQAKAVLVGIGTVLADDPMLISKIEVDAGQQPMRIVLDSRQRIPSDCKLVRTAREHPTLVFTLDAPQARLTDAGVEVTQVGADEAGRIDLLEAMDILATRGIGPILVEGGGEVAASFLRLDIVDDIEWFRAPILLGAEGRPAIGELGVTALADASRWRLRQSESATPDIWERYARPTEDHGETVE